MVCRIFPHCGSKYLYANRITATSHPLVKETYNGYVRRKDKALKCRKDQSLIAQLRAGHCLMLSHYKNRIDDKKSPIYPDCAKEEETVRHWLKCPAKIRTREDVFGRADVNPDTMNKDPQPILAYAEATLIKRNP